LSKDGKYNFVCRTLFLMEKNKETLLSYILEESQYGM